jgi:hypothetical protein
MSSFGIQVLINIVGNVYILEKKYSTGTVNNRKTKHLFSDTTNNPNLDHDCTVLTTVLAV